jgi:hypothetical protein
MESFFGYVESLYDAYVLIEACRLGVIQGVKSRFTDIAGTPASYDCVRSGSVFVWSENKTGIKRWRDLKSWSASRHVGGFLMYKEIHKKKRLELGRDGSPRTHQKKSTEQPPTPTSHSQSTNESKDVVTSTSTLKSNGLVKKTFSVKTIYEEKFHLVSYYYLEEVLSHKLRTPSETALGKNVKIPKGIFVPELDTVGTSDPLYTQPLGGHFGSIRYDVNGKELVTSSSSSSSSSSYGQSQPLVANTSHHHAPPHSLPSPSGNRVDWPTAPSFAQKRPPPSEHSPHNTRDRAPPRKREKHDPRVLPPPGPLPVESCLLPLQSDHQLSPVSVSPATANLSIPTLKPLNTPALKVDTSKGSLPTPRPDSGSLHLSAPDFIVHNSWIPSIRNITFPYKE